MRQHADNLLSNDNDFTWSLMEGDGIWNKGKEIWKVKTQKRNSKKSEEISQKTNLKDFNLYTIFHLSISLWHNGL